MVADVKNGGKDKYKKGAGTGAQERPGLTSGRGGADQRNKKKGKVRKRKKRNVVDPRSTRRGQKEGVIGIGKKPATLGKLSSELEETNSSIKEKKGGQQLALNNRRSIQTRTGESWGERTRARALDEGETAGLE